MDDLATKVQKLELLLDVDNKERAKAELEAKKERELLNKHLNEVTKDHEERLKVVGCTGVQNLISIFNLLT